MHHGYGVRAKSGVRAVGLGQPVDWLTPQLSRCWRVGSMHHGYGVRAKSGVRAVGLGQPVDGGDLERPG